MIVIDSREQNPWKFGYGEVVKALKTGDYSIEGFEDKISIERKSVKDAIHSVTTGRKRFEREWIRAKDFYYFAVVIEGTFDSIYKAVGFLNKINKKKGRRSLSAESVIATYIKWQVKYPWVHVFFTKNRGEAMGVARRIFDGFMKYEKDRVNLIKIKKEKEKEEWGKCKCGKDIDLSREQSDIGKTHFDYVWAKGKYGGFKMCFGCWYKAREKAHKKEIKRKKEVWNKPCRAMRESIHMKEGWCGDLPELAPTGKCYFTHKRDCNETCKYWEEKVTVDLTKKIWEEGFIKEREEGKITVGGLKDAIKSIKKAYEEWDKKYGKFNK